MPFPDFKHILCQIYYICVTNIQFLCYKGWLFNSETVLNVIQNVLSFVQHRVVLKGEVLCAVFNMLVLKVENTGESPHVASLGPVCRYSAWILFLPMILCAPQERPVEVSDWRKNVEAMSGMEGRKKMFDAAKGPAQ